MLPAVISSIEQAFWEIKIFAIAIQRENIEVRRGWR